ncbi:MAG: type VI secretion system tip protein TssI/VgrG, partial [Pseudomonadota bacterium]
MLSDYTQIARPFQVLTPLPFDTLLLQSMTGEEELGRLSRYDLELLSTDDEIDTNALLGQPMCVRVISDAPGLNTEDRFFHGNVSRIAFAGYRGRLAQYRVELRPWLWFLTRTTDCRVYQGLTVLEIAKQVFADNGFGHFEDLTTETYRPREYCVQYRESDFDFISRLFELEGIYYYFQHEMNKHTLIITDGAVGHGDEVGEIPFTAADATTQSHQRSVISQWTQERKSLPGTYTHRSYDFTKPRVDLTARASSRRGHAQDTHEVFDFPAPDVQFDSLDQFARIRLEELHAEHALVYGETNARMLGCGCQFALRGYPRKDQNGDHLIKAAGYRVQNVPFEAGEKVVEAAFDIQFTALP